MNNEKEIKPVEVFAGQQWEALLVKSLLENAEIEAFLKDETMASLNPWYVSAGGIDPFKVIVSSEDAERAMIVVKEYEENARKEDDTFQE